ncbi:unnamed protein product [Choristocarpus tenellus]
MDDSDAEDEVATDLSNSDVTTKYQEAAKICNLALQGLTQQCVPGAKINDLCKFGDTVILQRCSQIFRNKVKGVAIDKGVAFPTCVSVNECVVNNCPLESEAGNHKPLAEGDLVKIDLGCHIDGYIAVGAHTTKVGKQPTKDSPLTGKEADVILAAKHAAEVAVKSIKAGTKNTEVTEAVKKVADAYGVNFLAGTVMEQIKRYVISGNKNVALCAEDKVDEITFETNEVYSVNVIVSSGEGKAREQETRTTVFKRAVDKNYRLKMKASRYLFNSVNTRFPTLPFTLRAVEDEKQQARLGVVECVSHELLTPYPVLYERVGDIVAQVKVTVLLLPSGTIKVTGMDIDATGLSSEKVVDAETQAILDIVTSKKRRNRKKKPAAASGENVKAMDEA